MASANAGFLGGAGMIEDPAVRAPFHLGTLVLFKFSAELTLFIIKKRVDGVILVKIQQGQEIRVVLDGRWVWLGREDALYVGG